MVTNRGPLLLPGEREPGLGQWPGDRGGSHPGWAWLQRGAVSNTATTWVVGGTVTWATPCTTPAWAGCGVTA